MGERRGFVPTSAPDSSVLDYKGRSVRGVVSVIIRFTPNTPLDLESSPASPSVTVLRTPQQEMWQNQGKKKGRTNESGSGSDDNNSQVRTALRKCSKT